MELVAEILALLIEEGVWSAVFHSAEKKADDSAAASAEIRLSSMRSSKE